MEERTPEIAIEYLEHYKNAEYGMMPEWVWDMAIKALKQEPKTEQLTNSQWIDFLSEQFNISRTSAKEMLHVMMSVKREDNLKKQFSGRK